MTRIQRIRVPAGFVFAALALWLSRPNPTAFSAGAVLALGGLGLRIWAAGHLEKLRKLAKSGPYRFTRNPLYLGSFLIGSGFSISSGLVWLALLFPLVFLALYLPVMRREEKELQRAFEDYGDYRRDVPLFFPWPTRIASGQSAHGGFRWNRVKRNREYNAAVGLAILLSALCIKML